MSEFRSVMPFPETRAGQRPRSNGAVCRAMPVWNPGILNAWDYSNFGNRRSLSGQRAFTQVGKHAPNRGGEGGLLGKMRYTFL